MVVRWSDVAFLESKKEKEKERKKKRKEKGNEKRKGGNTVENGSLEKISISIFDVWRGRGRKKELEKEAVIQVRRSVCESSGNLHLKELEDTLGRYGVPGVPFRRLFLFSRNFLGTENGLKRN